MDSWNAKVAFGGNKRPVITYSKLALPPDLERGLYCVRSTMPSSITELNHNLKRTVLRNIVLTDSVPQLISILFTLSVLRKEQRSTA